MRLIAIGGEPGSGKSTLVGGLIAELGESRRIRSGLIRAVVFESLKLAILGVYDDSRFPGTDRLSMAVQPETIKFLQAMRRSNRDDWCILFEGDRLFTASFLGQARELGADVRCLILTVSPGEQQRRFRERQSNQPEGFIRGRRTKIANIQKVVEHELWSNENPTEQRLNQLKLKQLVTST